MDNWDQIDNEIWLVRNRETVTAPEAPPDEPDDDIEPEIIPPKQAYDWVGLLNKTCRITGLVLYTILKFTFQALIMILGFTWTFIKAFVVGFIIVGLLRGVTGGGNNSHEHY